MIDTARIQSLSIDVYGTLIDWESGITAALRPWAGRNKVALTDDELIYLFNGQEQRVQDERPFRQYTQVLAETMRRIGAELQRPVSDVEANAFSRSVGSWLPFDDTVESLQRLIERFPLIVASNCDDVSLRQSTDLLGLEFTDTITAEDVGSYKPAHRHFDAIAAIVDKLGIDRDRHLHIANHLEQDLRPASAMGFLTCHVDRHHDRASHLAVASAADFTPDSRFSTLADLTDVLLGPTSTPVDGAPTLPND